MNLGEKNYCPMKRIISIIAVLVLIGVSCQNSADPQKLREKVMASPEFAALVDAYENRSNDLVNEGGQAVTSFKAEEEQKKLIDETLGNVHASQDQIEEVTKLFVSLGGIEETARRARAHVERGMKFLDPLPQTKYRDWLADWAHLMIEREF